MVISVKDMFPNAIVNKIENIFRYLIPGILAIFLFKVSYPTEDFHIRHISEGELYIYIPMFGMVIYGIHRSIFWVVDMIQVKCIGYSYHEFTKKRYDDNANISDGLSDYLHYKLAILHYCLILSELVLIFSLFFHEESSFIGRYSWTLTVISVLLLMISFYHYMNMNSLEIRLIFQDAANAQEQL